MPGGGSAPLPSVSARFRNLPEFHFFSSCPSTSTSPIALKPETIVIMPKIHRTRQLRSSLTTSNPLPSKSTPIYTTPLPGRRPSASVRLQRVNGRFSRDSGHQATSSSDMSYAGRNGSSSRTPFAPSGCRVRRRRQDPLESSSSRTESGPPTRSPLPATIHPGTIFAGHFNFSQTMKRGTSQPVAYVDKSSAIKTFSGLRGFHLLLRPRRSGKTTLLQMLQYFLESDHVVDGINSDSESRLSRMRAINLDVLKPSPDWNWQDHFARHPVIHLNFKTYSPDTYHERLVKSIVKYWLKWEGLFRSAGLSRKQCDMVDWWTCDERWSNFASVDLRTGLADLIKLIHEVTGSKVIVLIDEYDYPFNITSTDKNTMQATADAQKFFGSFYSSSFDDNAGLKFALLVGVSGAPAKDWNTMVKSLTIHTIHKKPETPNADLSYVAMLTDADVEGFYQSVAHEKPQLSTTLSMNDIKSWYDGYETYSGVKLYNPLSISRALSLGRVGLYWIATGATSELVGMIAKASEWTRGDLVKLASGATTYIEMPMSSDDLHGFAPQRPTPEVGEVDRSAYALLIHAGYLSVKSAGAVCHVQIPNNEVHRGFWKDWLSNLTGES